MGKFNYSLGLGGYDEPVRVDINVTIKNGLSKEDYEIIRSALETIENTARKYIGEENK